MGNRCYLYLSADAPDSIPEEIAEGNNSIPRLWSFLLAGSRLGEAVDDQRVFGDAGSPGVQADARAGVARLERLFALIRTRPEMGEIEALDRHLDAVLAHLHGLIQVAEAANGHAIFSANLDEITWFYGGPAADAIDRLRQDFDRHAALLDEIEAEGAAHRLETLLGFDEFRSAFTDWNHWCWGVGLGSFSHPYFDGIDSAPAQVAFDRFEPDEPDDAFGALLFAGAGAWDESSFADDAHSLAWVRRGAVWGLMRLGADPVLLLPPQFSDVWDFENGHALAALDGREGLLDAQGRWVIRPQHEEIFRPEGGIAIVADQGLYGWRDLNDRLLVAPRFSQIEDFGDADWVWAGDDAGLQRFDRSGACLGDDRFDRVEAATEMPGHWRVWRADHCGVVDGEGRNFIACVWERIDLNEWPGLHRVVRNGRCGVLAAPDRLLVDCAHLSLDLLGVVAAALEAGEALGDSPAESDDLAAWLQRHPTLSPCLAFRAEVASGVGVIDERGRELVPPRYRKVEPSQVIERTASGALALPHAGLRWLSLQDDERRVGVWDLQQGREVRPCAHDEVWPLGASGACPELVVTCEHRGLLDAAGEPSQSLRLFFADGTPALPGSYRWIARAMSMRDGFQRTLVLLNGLAAWSIGESAEAEASESGQRVWVAPGREPILHFDRLRAAAEHDPAAALRLAVDLRQGDGMPADPVLGRDYAQRAAQHLPAGRALLASYLANGEGGPPDLPRARVEAQAAFDGGHREPGSLNLLGWLLGQVDAGPVDPVAEAAHYRESAQAGDALGHYNLGVSLRDGSGVACSKVGARRAFEDAIRLGYAPAQLSMALLLSDEADAADALDEGARRAIRRRALVHAHKNADRIGPADAQYATTQWIVGKLLLDIDGAAAAPQACEWLLRAAEAGDPDAGDLLAERCYGDPASPCFDAAQAAHWRRHPPVSAMAPRRQWWRWWWWVVIGGALFVLVRLLF